MVRGRAPRPSLRAQLRLRVADDRLAVLLGDRVDPRDAVRHLGDGRAHHDLVLGQAHAAELDAQPPQRRRVAGRLGLGARDLRHRPQPVEDPPGQADLPGELLVDVDRVEVAGRARVADGEVPVGRDADLRQLLAGLERHRQTPRTMLVQVPTHTASPSWLVDVDSKTKNPLPARSSIDLTATSVVTSSPATTSGPQTNSCPPWTISAKLIPTSGS